MKSTNPVITLLGSNSGRNVGDAAILSSILETFSKAVPETEFLVPTTSPTFVNKNYSPKYNVKAFSIMPWTASIRFVGIPTFLALARSDVALICDGIIFGKKLWNPFFNWLIALIFVVPYARLVGCKVVCYSCGIGPFPSKISRIFAKFVLNNCDLVILRERDSKALAEEIGVTKPITVTGDAAFVNPVSSKETGLQMLKDIGIDTNKKILGVNVTAYLDQWLPAAERKTSKEQSLIKVIANGVNAFIKSNKEEIQIVAFSTHPMDEVAVNELAGIINAPIISNTKYLSHDMQAAMALCDLFLGMRFHSLVLSSAVGAPIVGMLYMLKCKGYMRLLDCEEYGLSLGDLTEEKICTVLNKAWACKAELKSKQQVIVKELIHGAYNATDEVVKNFFSSESYNEEMKKASGW